MPIQKFLRLAVALISLFNLVNLSACSSVAEDIVPKKGPTMEQIYDGGAESKTLSVDSENNDSDKPELKKLRAQLKDTENLKMTLLNNSIPESALSQSFHKVPNPELRMYITPHLAGKDEMPVPGYYTAFNVYDHDHYALAQEE